MKTAIAMTTNNTQDMISVVEKCVNFQVPRDNLNYMYGWMRSFIRNLENTVPGVKEQIEFEIAGIQRTGRLDHSLEINS